MFNNTETIYASCDEEVIITLVGVRVRVCALSFVSVINLNVFPRSQRESVREADDRKDNFMLYNTRVLPK